MDLTAAQIVEMVPFARTLGVEFTSLSDEAVEARLLLRPELSTLGGGLHGGAIMGLTDLVGAVTAALDLSDGDTWTTVESTTNFYRAVHGEHVIARGAATKTGKSLIFVEVDVLSDNAALLARTSQLLSIQRMKTK